MKIHVLEFLNIAKKKNKTNVKFLKKYLIVCSLLYLFINIRQIFDIIKNLINFFI